MGAEDLPAPPDLWHPVERLLFARWEAEMLEYLNAELARLEALYEVVEREGRAWTPEEALAAADLGELTDVARAFPNVAWWHAAP